MDNLVQHYFRVKGSPSRVKFQLPQADRTDGVEAVPPNLE